MAKVVKVPCQLEAFSFRKTTQDWVISFTVQQEQLDFAKPLMELMNSSFVIACVNVEDEQEVSKALKGS